MDLLIMLLAAYGLCFGLMNEKAPPVNWLLYRLPVLRDRDHGTNFFTRMLDCAFCTGFHTGWVVWVVINLPAILESKAFDMERGSSLISFSFASAAFCYAVDTLLQRIER